jgi:hypothetical protein
MKESLTHASDELRSETAGRRGTFTVGPARQTGEPCPRCGPSPSVALFETSLRTFYQCLLCRRPFGYARPGGQARPT